MLERKQNPGFGRGFFISVVRRMRLAWRIGGERWLAWRRGLRAAICRAGGTAARAVLPRLARGEHEPAGACREAARPVDATRRDACA
ncbi:hypothetical protein ACX84Z_21965, partial [Burkholderia pseudomallei]